MVPFHFLIFLLQPWTRVAGIEGGMNTEVLLQIQKETVVMVQLESEESFKNLRDIAAVPGVDVVMVGPLDLSATVGKYGWSSTRNKNS